jgi:hypothetical protein
MKYAEMLYYFGISPVRLKLFVDDKIEQWMKVYEYTYLGYKEPFASPIDIMKKLNFDEFLKISIK